MFENKNYPTIIIARMMKKGKMSNLFNNHQSNPFMVIFIYWKL